MSCLMWVNITVTAITYTNKFTLFWIGTNPSLSQHEMSKQFTFKST